MVSRAKKRTTAKAKSQGSRSGVRSIVLKREKTTLIANKRRNVSSPTSSTKKYSKKKWSLAVSKVKQKKVKRNKNHTTRNPNDFLRVRRVRPLELPTETPYPVRNKHGNVLVGVLHTPYGGSDTLIIAVHGFRSNKERPGIKQVCIELSRVGIAAYRFDLSGNGDSEGRFEDATPNKLMDDIKSVITHFRKQYKRVILYGRSMGGYLCTLVAPTEHVESIIIVAAPMHWDVRFETTILNKQQREELRSVGFTTITKKSAYGELPLTLRDTFIADVHELKPLEAAARITCPALIAHGTLDEIVPPSDSEDLFVRIASKHKDLYLVGGADHKLSNPEHLEALTARIIAWVNGLR